MFNKKLVRITILGTVFTYFRSLKNDDMRFMKRISKFYCSLFCCCRFLQLLQPKILMILRRTNCSSIWLRTSWKKGITTLSKWTIPFQPTSTKTSSIRWILLKRYFTTSDLNDFSPFKTQIDDQIQNKDLTFFDLVYNRYIQRSNEVKAYYKDILSHPFDYTVSESINGITTIHPGPPMKTSWKNVGGNSWSLPLCPIFTIWWKKKTKPPKKAKEALEKGETYEMSDNAKLTKEWKPKPVKPPWRPWTIIIILPTTWNARITLRYSWTLSWRNSTRIPTILFSRPRSFRLADEWKVRGIGARLQKKNDYITIVEVISGGPVWRGEYMEVGRCYIENKARRRTRACEHCRDACRRCRATH